MDETDIHLGGRCFMWGGIFQPIDCDLASQLGKVRLKNRFVSSLHLSRHSRLGAKTTKVMEGFLDAFLESNACFRSIIVKTSEWNSLSDWKSKARLAGLLLSYPWVPAENQIFRVLSRARIIMDRNALNEIQTQEFHNSLNGMLNRKNKIFTTPTKPLKESSIVFANSQIFDELQLVDILNGIIHIAYAQKAGVSISPSKLALYDYFLKKFPLLPSFINASRSKTRQKIDVWEFKPN